MIGIDPGKSGGAVLIDSIGTIIDRIAFEKMTEHDIANTFREWSDPAQWGDSGSEAVIEKVSGGGPPNRKKGSAGAFHFGQSYGFLRGCLTMGNIRFRDVTPQTWQKAMGCLTHGDKNVSKAAAQRRWPIEKWTHALADAALIAEYGRITSK